MSPSSCEDDTLSHDQKIGYLFDQLSHLWHFPTPPNHRIAFRRHVTQVMVTTLNTNVFPVEETGKDLDRLAREVASAFMDLYAQLIWPTFYNSTNPFARTDEGREVWKNLVQYVNNLLQVPSIVQDLAPTEFDHVLETLKVRDVFPRRAISLPNLTDVRDGSLHVRPLRRDLVVDERRNKRMDAARIEGAKQRSLRRRDLFDGYLSSDDDGIQDDTVRKATQRSGADSSKSSAELREGTTALCETKSVQLQGSERWVQEDLVREYVRDDNWQRPLQEHFENTRRSRNDDLPQTMLERVSTQLNLGTTLADATGTDEQTHDSGHIVEELADSDEEVDSSEESCDDDNHLQCAMCGEWFVGLNALVLHHEKGSCFE